jgi:hypothetical protein
MEEYYKFDERWESFGVSDLKSYEDKFVIKGKFHDLVPKDIRESFITVEYLMAHAYYFWPMYDEAMNKALRILEMAIKLKAKELEIPLKKPDKKGKEWDMKQAELIDIIWNGEHFKELKARLDRARKIRNWGMHPDKHYYMGGTTGPILSIKVIVAALNDVFRPEKYFVEQYAITKNVQEKLDFFNNNLTVLEYDQPSLLIYKFCKTKIIDGQLFIVCLPVLQNAYENFKEHKYDKMLSLRFAKFEIGLDEISGVSVTGNKIRLFITTKKENIIKRDLFINDLERLSKTDKDLYDAYYEFQAPNQLSKDEYDYYMEQK